MKSTQAIQVKYMSPTTTQNTRIKLIDKRYHTSVKLSYDYEIGNVLTQASEWLEARGYTVHTHSTFGQDDWIITVDHTDGFRDIKEVS